MSYKLFLWLALKSAVVLGQVDILGFVDNLIGTDNGGNVFAGATRPHSMAKAVADVNGQNTGGFATDNTPIIGFSNMHDLGTGGNSSLGNFPLFPELCPGDDINRCVYTRQGQMVSYDNTSVVAEPGYFAPRLVNGIKAQMAVGERSALYQFTFPNSAVDNATTYGNHSLGPPAGQEGRNIAPLVMLDLEDLWSSRQNASIDVDSMTGRMTGNGTFSPSFGSGSYMLHFCAAFASCTAMWDNGMHVNSRAGLEPKTRFATRGINAFYIQAGGWVRFEPDARSNQTVISARVGLSFISARQACQNTEHDIPNSKPDTMVNIVRSMIDTQKHLGWLPDCRMSLCKGFTQGGSNADNVIADLYAKNITADIDWTSALTALVKDAEVEPLDWSNEGRGGIQSWHDLGYIPYMDYDDLAFGVIAHSISRTLEYAYNDYNMGMLGKGLGLTNYTTYLGRSTNWENIFLSSQNSSLDGTDTGFTGFFQPRYANGTWGISRSGGLRVDTESVLQLDFKSIGDL